MEPSFEKLLVVLAEAKVKFIVVGGVAAGQPSTTPQCAGSYGEGFARELSLEDFTDEEGAIRIVEEVESCQMDLFTVMAGKHYADIIGDADWFSVGDHSIAFASKASLIAWKGKSVREKDRLDALALQRLSENPREFD